MYVLSASLSVNCRLHSSLYITQCVLLNCRHSNSYMGLSMRCFQMSSSLATCSSSRSWWHFSSLTGGKQATGSTISSVSLTSRIKIYILQLLAVDFSIIQRTTVSNAEPLQNRQHAILKTSSTPIGLQFGMLGRHGTGSHFVTQRPSDSGIQWPGDPVDPVTLFYNELQMSTYV